MTRYSRRAFISYSAADREIALGLWSAFCQGGLEPWIAEFNIPGGDQSWASELDLAIRLSDFVVLLLSDNSVRSRHVAKELGIADKCGKPIIVVEAAPVSIADTDEHARTIGYYTINVQKIFLTEVDITECVAIIRRSVEARAPKDKRLSTLEKSIPRATGDVACDA